MTPRLLSTNSPKKPPKPQRPNCHIQATRLSRKDPWLSVAVFRRFWLYLEVLYNLPSIMMSSNNFYKIK
jgi:hypothetical protein